MKRRHLLNLAGIAVLACGTAGANAQITGSAHDFSNAGWSRGQICLPCHTPHNVNEVEINGFASGPLWNHALPAESQLYTLYDTVDPALRNDALDVNSILCMGCHDGTVALDSFGGRTGVQFINGSELIGTDLSNDHPVGATAIYPIGSNSFKDPTTWPSGMGKLKSMLVNSVEEKVVGCSTCHTVHNKGNNEFMLRLNNSGSTLCLACHVK